MRIGRRLATFLGLALLAAPFLLLARSEEPAPPRMEPPVPRVQVALVTEVRTRREARFPGVTRAERRATLSFSVAARVGDRPLEVGQRVAPDQVLARLEDREFRNAVLTARAAVAEVDARLAQAEREQGRVERLAEARAATGVEQEEAATAVRALRATREAAAARLEEADRVLDQAVLRAPFAGTVTALYLEAGEWAGPGQPVVELSGDGALELRVEVPESVVTGLQEGRRITVELPFAGNARVAGRLASVARAASGASRLFPVLVALDPSPALAAGLTAELLVKVETTGVVTVPLAAVVNPGSSRPAVFRLDGDRVRRKAVRLGRVTEDRVEVSGDLRPGDRVVTAGNAALADGDRVEVGS